MATPKDRANDTSRQLVRDDSKLMPPLATHEEEQIRNYRRGDGVFPKKVKFEAGNPFHQKIVSDASHGITTGFPLREVPKEPSTRKQETQPRNRVYKETERAKPETKLVAPAAPVSPKREVEDLGVKVTAKGAPSGRDKIIADKQAALKASKEKAKADAAARAAKMQEILNRNS